MATSFQLAQFVVSRVIVGLGTGGIIATVSVWQAETAKGKFCLSRCIKFLLIVVFFAAESRGEHVSAFGIYCGLGLLVCLWLEFGCSYINSSASWRFPLVLPVLFSAIVMTFIFSLPESPRYDKLCDLIREFI